MLQFRVQRRTADRQLVKYLVLGVFMRDREACDLVSNGLLSPFGLRKRRSLGVSEEAPREGCREHASPQSWRRVGAG